MACSPPVLRPLTNAVEPTNVRSMTSTFKTIGLTVKFHLENKDAVVASVVRVLQGLGAEVLIDEHTLGDVSSVAKLRHIMNVADLDLLIAVGGDGTILRSIRELKPGSVPVVAINAGSVGFLSEMPLSDMESRLPSLLGGGGLLEHRSCLDADVVRDGTTVFSCIALNDVVISQGTISRLLDLDASIGGQFLTAFHADGLIVSTPTGSTAYSLAAGGPVVHPVVNALILTPINPHSFTQKPIVIPGDSAIEVRISDSTMPPFENATVGLTVDGQVYYSLQPGDTIVARTGMAVHFLRENSDAFYRALRTKLKWGEGLDN